MGFTMNLSAFSAYLKAHEKLIVYMLAVGLVWGITGKVQSVIAAHDEKVFNKTLAATATDAQKNASNAASNAALAQQFQQANAQLTAANAQLSQANAQLSQALAKQKAVDATLPPAQLAARIEVVAKLPEGSAIAKPDNTIALTQPAAVTVVQQLEEVPVLTTQLSNTQQENGNLSKLLVDQTARVDGLNTQVTGLQKTNTDEIAQCTAEKKVIQDKAEKDKRRWAAIGLAIGAILHAVIK